MIFTMVDIKKGLFLRALNGEKVERIPVWIMRQASRYLPEHIELREREGFEKAIKTPELIAELSLQPIRRFSPDAAIVYSDILMPCEAMGMKVSFDESGPHFTNPVRTTEQISALHEPYSDEELPYVLDAIKVLKEELNELKIPLIGFVGGPFTVTAYLIEGKPSRSLGNVKAMMHQAPDMFHRLARLVTSTLANHLQAQIRAGCDVVQIFDTWTGFLSTADFREFSFPYIQELLSSVENTVPRIYFTVDCIFFLPELSAIGADAISVDWRTDLAFAREHIPEDIGIQGNLDPTILLADKELIKGRVLNTLQIMDGRPRYIFNLGHGVLPQTDPEAINVLVEEVRKFKPTWTEYIS